MNDLFLDHCSMMDDLHHSILSGQLTEMPYLTPQINTASTAYVGETYPLYHHHEPIKIESLDQTMLAEFVETDLHIDLNANANTFSHTNSTQSISPPMPNVFDFPDLPLQTSSSFDSQPSPPSASESRKNSIGDDSHKAERRRAQNRAAQRAYRQRKDQSLRERENEIETLRSELDKAQRLNQTLWKVIAVQRERLKPVPVSAATEPLKPVTTDAHARAPDI